MILATKKCRIYAAYGVLQTPRLKYIIKGDCYIMLIKIQSPKMKKLIEFWCVCAIIGCISGVTWTDSMVRNIIVIIVSALVLAIVRVAIMFYSNSRRYNGKKNK